MSYVTDIGIDLGTTNIVIYIKGKGIVLKEPALVAYNRDAKKAMAFGEEARAYIGRTTGNISAVRPLKEGVISDYVITEKLLRYFIDKAMGRRGFFKPRIVISVPSRITDVEKRAVEEATYQAGAKEVFIVDESIAAAIGCGLDLTRPYGNLVVDIGGGITNISVTSMGGVVNSTTLPFGGDRFTENVIRHIRKNFLLFIGEQSAEAIKIRIGSAVPVMSPEKVEIKGRNVFSGLPSRVVLNSDELIGPFKEIGELIGDAVVSVLEQTTPELAEDIRKRGIILTGGGSLLNGLDEIISEKTGILTVTAENPLFSVAVGTGKYLEVMNEL